MNIDKIDGSVVTRSHTHTDTKKGRARQTQREMTRKAERGIHGGRDRDRY